MKMLGLFSILVFTVNAHAAAVKSANVECYFEIASTQAPAKYEIIKVPSFKLEAGLEHAVETPILKRRLLMGVYPGFNSAKEVDHVAIHLTYDSANSGTELPLILNDKFTVMVGRQGSDLIGGFLNCFVKP